MKWLITLLTGTLLFSLAGCTRHYVIATRDGKVIQTRGEPHTVKETGQVEYIDRHGQKQQINGDEISSMIER